MCVETTPEVKPPPSRNQLLIIIGAAVVVLLAVIAIAVSSQAIGAGQEADAQVSAVASASAMSAGLDAAQKVIDDQRAANAKEANTVCEKRLIQKHPTATPQAGKTKSTYKASDNSDDTTGWLHRRPGWKHHPDAVFLFIHHDWWHELERVPKV